MHTTPTGLEEEAEEKEQQEEQKRLVEEDILIIMRSRLLSNAFKCLSPGQTRHMSSASSIGNSIQSAIDIAKESEAEALKNVPKMTY